MNFLLVVATLILCLDLGAAFGIGISNPRSIGIQYGSTVHVGTEKLTRSSSLWMSEEKREDGVIELVDDDEETVAAKKQDEEKSVAPFLSQGEIQEEVLKVDLSNPKQTRVIIYIILSLLPVLFLIPLMLGSREFLPAIIPMDDLPPVQM